MAGRRSSSRRGSARRSSNSATAVLLEPIQPVGWVKNLFGCPLEGGCSLKLVLACAAGAVTAAGLALANYADLLRLASLFFSVAVPLFALVCCFSLLALCYRTTWTTTAIYFTLCGAFVAETVAFIVGTAWRYSTGQQDVWGWTLLLDPLHVWIHLAGTLLSAGITCRWAIEGVWIATCIWLLRSVGCLCVPLASLMRLMATYTAALTGVFTAKFVSLTLDPPLMTLMHRSHGAATSRHAADAVASRRRRTSSSALSQSPQSPAKVRRTSLPALLANKNQYPSTNSSYGVDMALLSEAHGLITDLLLESQTMPPHLVSGLKALGTLLSPPLPSGFRPKHMAHAHVALADIQSTSDTEEIPYTGEPLPALSKRGKRFIPPNLLRRMSTSTWTTTTSATGLPTIEPEPCRKRTASFRNTHELLPPSLSPNHSHVSLNSLVSSADPAVIPVYKNRSHSTTSLYTNQHNPRKFTRERKTVCSIYPLHSDDKQSGYQASLSDADTRGDDSETDPTITGPNSAVSSRRGSALSIRRGSSGGTTGSRRGSGAAKVGDESRPSVEITESELRSAEQSCARCHRARAQGRTSTAENDSGDGMRVRKQGKPRTSDYESSDSPNSSDHCEDAAFHFNISHLSEDSESEKEPVHVLDLPEAANPRLILLEDGSCFDLDQLDSDQLLAGLKEWDYPIFDLLRQTGELILSSTCYRVFLEVGLFETFRIPMEEFFCFFHSLEKGYRDIPYHNRTHAADVLHAVYYLTSQPIPGFQVLPADAEAQVKGNETASPALTQRASFDFEDSYGIMGANFPALELMALYTAAAMHDYDHPGRTNAFLVSTLAPQAILYNDRSVLENHHAASAWSLFLSDPRFNFLLHLERGEFKRFRYLIIEAILATDLKRHFEILAEFNAKVNDADAPGIDWTSETDRLLVMQMCIKLADINGPCKSHAIHVEWTDRIVEEFYEQGDEEAALGLPVSPYMDRNNPQLPKLQESFINHLVAPLCNAFGQAGLLPAVWDERSDEDHDVVDDDDDDDEGDGTEKSSGCDLTDIDTESMVSEVSCSDLETTLRLEKDSLAKRKILCVHTRHLKENHEYWVALIKEEQMHQSGVQAPADCDSRDSVTFLPVEERMEPIAEEHSPRLDRSFSFEPEESKL